MQGHSSVETHGELVRVAELPERTTHGSRLTASQGALWLGGDSRRSRPVRQRSHDPLDRPSVPARRAPLHARALPESPRGRDLAWRRREAPPCHAAEGVRRGCFVHPNGRSPEHVSFRRAVKARSASIRWERKDSPRNRLTCRQVLAKERKDAPRSRLARRQAQAIPVRRVAPAGSATCRPAAPPIGAVSLQPPRYPPPPIAMRTLSPESNNRCSPRDVSTIRRPPG